MCSVVGISYLCSLQFAEGDAIKLLVMILDLLVSAVLSIITLTKDNSLGKNESSSYLNENCSNGTNSTATTGQAIASVVIFAFAGLSYIIIIGIIVIYYCKTKQHVFHRRRNLVAHVLLRRHSWVALGGLCYYIGDNLPPLIEEYRDELKCCSDCFEVIQLIGASMLGIAAITYLPVLINVVPEHNAEVQTEVHNQENDDEYVAIINNTEEECKKNLIIAAVIMLARTTNFDLVYTAIERTVSITCNTLVVIGAWVYWIFYIGFFLSVSLYQLCTYEKAEIRKSASAQSGNTMNADNIASAGNTMSYLKEYTKRNCTQTCTLGTFYAILLSVFAGLYILADTRLPLASTGAAKDDTRTRNVIRISLWGVTLAVAVCVVILWTCWQNKHHKRYTLYIDFRDNAKNGNYQMSYTLTSPGSLSSKREICHCLHGST